MQHGDPRRSSARTWRVRVGTIVASASLSVACSLTAIDPQPCNDDGDCRHAFGVGSVCQDDGYCSTRQIHPRCNQSWPPELLVAPDTYGDAIVIGSLFSFVDHLDTRNAAELAIRELELQQGLAGQRIAMLHCDATAMVGDGKDDLEGSADAARFLAEVIGVPAIVGPRGSSRTQAVFEAVRDDDVLVISPSATSAALTGIDAIDPSFEQPGLLWRTVPPDTLQSEVIAADMRDRGVTRVAVAYQTGAYGEGLASLFETRFMATGGVSVERQPFSDGQFAGIVAQVGDALVAGSIDEILFVSSDLADYVGFFAAATATTSMQDAYATEGTGIFLADAAYNTGLLEMTAAKAGPLFAHVRGTRPAPAAGTLFNTFAAAYAAAKYGDADASGFTPHAYDATWLVLYGLARASFDEPAIDGIGIARGLRRISGGDAIDIAATSWPSVVEHFRSGASIDVTGASGPLDYDPDTEETTAPISLWAIEPDAVAPSGFAFVELARIDPGA